MADTVEMQDIRGLDIDKLAKGFADEAYVFKSDCQIAQMNGDSVRWYAKTAGTLSAVTPSATSNVGRLSMPTNLEVSWTRNLSFIKKYFVSGFISMEEINTADLDVLATTIRDLTRVISRDVDVDIFDVMTENFRTTQYLTSTNINYVQVAAPWNTASFTNVDIVADIMQAKRKIWSNSYNPEGASLYLSPLDYEKMVTWLISSKGSSIPGFSSEKIATGTVLQILGLNVKVSNNVTASGALIVIPQVATTFRQGDSTTAKSVEDPGLGTKIVVWESGIAYNTDPKAICILLNTQTHL